MNFNLYTIVDGSEIDISNQSGNLSWSYQAQTLGVNLTFDYAKINDQEIKPGSIILLKDIDDQEVIILGIVVDRTRKGKVYNLSIYDFAFYLNKSEMTIQFNNTNATTAIEQLLKKAGIEIGSIPWMSTLITKIYIDTTISQILNEIIDQVFLETGIKYFFEMNGSKLDIKKVGAEVFEGSFKLADNLAPIMLEDVIGKDFTITDSISELKNSIIVLSSEADSVRILERAKDQASINQYGLLQDIISIDAKDEAKARNIANQALKEFNRVVSAITLPVLGHKGLKQYRTLKINDADMGLVGDYLILSASHTYAGGVYKVSLSVEVRS